MSLPLRDNDRHTYADYLTWPEDVRVELIDGLAYIKGPTPYLEHQEVAGEVFAQAATALRETSCHVFIGPLDVRMPKADASDESTDTVVQPDVLVVCDETKLDRRGVRGAPDWVVEVLSPATAGHDQVRKRRISEQAGVREYWLVHPVDRVLTVYRLGADAAYGKPDMQVLEGETPVGVLPGVVIAWDELAGRLPKPEY
jgi:Uma2 family endonuclease